MMHNDYHHYTRQEWQTVYNYKKNNRQQETKSEPSKSTKLTLILHFIHMVQDKTDGGLDDAATAFSAMTMNSALKDRRISCLKPRLKVD
jgi:hypothetical protein